MATKNKKIGNVPNLRFPGFEGEWVSKKLGEITKWTSGGTPSKDNLNYWNGDIPWISASSMRGNEYSDSQLKISEKGLKYGSKLAKKDSLLILVRGSMLFNRIPIGIALNDVSFNQDVKSIEVLDKINSRFILNKLYSIEGYLLNIVTGTGIGAGKLDLDELKDISISLPILLEQEKIETFLSLIDERIRTQNKIIDKLKTLMQVLRDRLLRQKIRFKDEDRADFPEWERQELGELLYYEQPTKYLVESTEYDGSYSIPVLTAGKTFVLGYSNETKGIFSENLPVIIFDDFTTAIKFVDFPFKVKSSAMKILLPKKGVNIYYVFEAMKSIDYTIGGHERHWISKYSKIIIPTPCSEEQTKIADSLSTLYNKISIEIMLLQQFENQKKYLLQNLFI